MAYVMQWQYMITCNLVRSGISLVSMQTMLLLFPSVTTVAIPVILILSAPNLAMMISATKLVMLEKNHETLSKVEVVKDVEVEMAVEVVQVVGLILMGSMLLRTVQQK